jgi:hypothetical protein
MSKILIDEAVVRQALEALDELTDAEQTYGALDRGDKAITALRQALADAALDKKADNARALGLSYEPPVQQEPVYAFRRKGQESFCTCDERRYDELSGKPSLFEVAIFYTTPPAQEPDPDELTIAYMSGVYEGKKRKPWVGLTNEEVKDCIASTAYSFKATDIARAVEAKLMEKNQ